MPVESATRPRNESATMNAVAPRVELVVNEAIGAVEPKSAAQANEKKSVISDEVEGSRGEERRDYRTTLHRTRIGLLAFSRA